MRGLSRAAYGAALMVLGAQALAQYLIYTEAAFVDRLHPISSDLQLAFLVVAIVGSALDQRKAGSDLREPSPRYSGVAVLMIIGMTAAMAAGRSNYLYALMIALGTMAAAAAVCRFATTHAHEIGEARFPSVSTAE